MTTKAIRQALEEIKEQRKIIESMRDVSIKVESLCGKHEKIGFISYGLCVTTSCHSISFSPEKISDIAPLLKDMRELFGQPDVTQKPERSLVSYHYDGHGLSNRAYLVVYLNKSCTFKQVGVKTQEVPIYEIHCA